VHGGAQRREGQDVLGNERPKGLEQTAAPTYQGTGESCVYHDEAAQRVPLGMSEIALDVTPGDPVTVREPESRLRKSAES
jgi:hypothetical protein